MYTYLASPYTHSDTLIREARYMAAMKAFTWLLNRRIWAFSPIVHCHPAAIADALPTDAGFWMSYDMAILIPAESITILCIPGWDESVGVRSEVSYCREVDKPIHFMIPTSHKDYTISAHAPKR